MIDRRDVAKTIETELATVGPTRLMTAPVDPPDVYGVVELPPGFLHDEGDMSAPEAHLVLRFSTRSVARSADTDVAAEAALDLDHRYEARLLDRANMMAGDGWRMAMISPLSTGGADPEPPFVNVVTDYEATFVPAPALP